MNDTLKKLIELADAKIEKVQSIMDYTAMQAEALKENNIDKLIQETDNKQKVIDNINKNDAEFEDKYQQLILSHGELHEDFAVLKKKVDEILEIMSNINDLEQKNKTELENQMEAVKRRIKQVNVGKKGLNAYSRAGTQVSNFVDEKH